MRTLEDAVESLQKCIEVLQSIGDEETMEYFTGSRRPRIEQAARRIVDIGPLLYTKPRDYLHICLYESLIALHPETGRDVERMKSLFRPEAWGLAETVNEDTTWDEFVEGINRLRNSDIDGTDGEDVL